MKGVVKQTTDHAENTGTLLFLQEALSSPGTITQYLMAEFDKDTFMGSAISGSTGGDEYEINFSGDNYYRKKTDSGGTETLQCVDFSVDSMKIVFNNYNFFLAADGSALKHLSGMPIIMKGVTDTSRLSLLMRGFLTGDFTQIRIVEIPQTVLPRTEILCRPFSSMVQQCKSRSRLAMI